MKFAVGYQPPSEGKRFVDVVEAYQKSISEVYFAWPGVASGRPPIFSKDEIPLQEAERYLADELIRISKMGIKLDLLMNANCYGEQACSVAFEREICHILNKTITLGCHPNAVTTTSPFVAKMIKRHFPNLEIRASVNMRIGTIQAMEYLLDLFDSFYLQRDLQRDITYVQKIADWCHANGKKICMLLNSGCLRFCPYQSFHDNLIAHCEQIEQQENVPNWNPHLCWTLLKKQENWDVILKATWIRPEDAILYEGIVDVFKLATRQHSHPRMVIGAYVAGEFNGNLLELLEPGFSPALLPNYIDNSKFPDDWGKRTSSCISGCHQCGYCNDVLSQVIGCYN